MVDSKKHPGTKKAIAMQPGELRKLAEEIHRDTILLSGEAMTNDMQVTLHELRVHQIELEMQNEELRRMQNELDMSRKHFFDLYDLAPIGYCSVSRAGLVVQINRTASALFGVPREMMLKRSINLYILSADRDVFYLLSKHLFEFGGTQKCELRMLKQDGSDFWVSLTATTELNADAELELRIALLDYTDYKNAQNELERSNDQLNGAKQNLEDANNKMQAYQEQLHGLIAHQLQIKEQERIRIAREIHDELGSALTGIKANLSVAIHDDKISGKTSNPRLVDAYTHIDLAVDIVHKVISELRPSILDQLGVWAALEWYAEQVELQTGLRCHLKIDDLAQSIELDAERSTAIFRILQESLTNVTRHAEASEVHIDITLNNGIFIMKVADNGKGLGKAGLTTDHQSWGIVGMIERARFLGGDLEISDGAPGTLITLRLPRESKHD
jgi:PAS domain S-box-containing protein